MSRDDLVEALAAIEHQRWADWQEYLHSQGTDYSYTGSMTFSRERKEAWERQIATPYADLSEREKQSDREQVARYWPLIVEFVAEWLRQWNHVMVEDGPVLHGTLMDMWRDEMGQ